MSDHAGSMNLSPNGDIELKFNDAKSYLLTASTKSGDNVYVFFWLKNTIKTFQFKFYFFLDMII